MDEGVIAIVMFYGFLAAVILVPVWLKERTKRSAHALISQALEKGQTLDPVLMRQLTEGAKPPRDRARSSLGSGVILLALAGGFVVGAFALEDFSWPPLGGMMVPAAILGALGVAFVLLALVDYAAKKKEL